jgi:hypothetical protein
MVVPQPLDASMSLDIVAVFRRNQIMGYGTKPAVSVEMPAYCSDESLISCQSNLSA